MIKGRFKENAGRHIGIVNGKAKALKAGDVVELTENQATKFADKFEILAGKTSGPEKDDNGKPDKGRTDPAAGGTSAGSDAGKAKG